MTTAKRTSFSLLTTLLLSSLLMGCLKQNTSTTSARRNENKGLITGSNPSTKLSEENNIHSKLDAKPGDAKPSERLPPKTAGRNPEESPKPPTETDKEAAQVPAHHANCVASITYGGTWVSKVARIEGSEFQVLFNEDGTTTHVLDKTKYAFEVVVENKIISEIRFFDKMDQDSFEFAATSVKDNNSILEFELKYMNHFEEKTEGRIKPFGVVQLVTDGKQIKQMIGDGKVFVKDSKGANVITQDVKITTGINLINVYNNILKPGIYYVTIVSNNITTETIKQVIK